VVVDGRERFATRERFPAATEIRTGMMSEVADELAYGPRTAVVLVAHDYKFEVPVLRTVLARGAGYVGLLGSRKRGRAVLDFLAGEGVPPDLLAQVRTPVGLDVGARSVPEIALSIAAEVLAALAGRPGTPMRDRGAVAPSAAHAAPGALPLAPAPAVARR
jgi:xanthine dehydrogenase accessory factor